MTLASALYTGRVRHRRRTPPHEFDFPLFMVYLDLAELPTVLSLSRLWGTSRWCPARFRRDDYFGDPALPLADAVRDEVQRQIGLRPLGPVRMLTHLRYFGHIFNPVTFYYCFDAHLHLAGVLAQITNTPWNERHAYVLDARTAHISPSGIHRWRFGKDFYVSPFLPLDLEYDWSLAPPAPPTNALFVHMNVLDHRCTTPKAFDATLQLERREITPASLRAILVRYPFMTLQVIASIYTHALRLRMKRSPTFPHAPTLTPPAPPLPTPTFTQPNTTQGFHP